MSVFVQQQHSVCDFTGSDSWVILSEIEQSIKRKIEAVGTPLKDWDIQINYGIKTGYNDAFIISTEKRDEILANCDDDDERNRTAELIRPILRGRDIKRYGYEWANLWLIATFPARQYDINNYPAVKNYLLSFAKQQLIDAGYSWVADNHLADYCKQKLSQTGKYIEINGKRITLGNSQERARKKTSNKWFETQDSISYWDDFNQPKIIYIEIQTDNPNDGYPFPCFSFDENHSVILNTGYIMCSKSIDCRYILGILNSSIGRFISKLYVSQLQEKQFRMLAQYVSKFPLPNFNQHIKEAIIDLVQQRLETGNIDIENSINNYICSLFDFTQEEIKAIQITDN